MAVDPYYTKTEVQKRVIKMFQPKKLGVIERLREAARKRRLPRPGV